ncbi:MAG: hypothetical protein ACTSWY_08045 [Promethearchaeota archaeon]
MVTYNVTDLYGNSIIDTRIITVEPRENFSIIGGIIIGLSGGIVSIGISLTIFLKKKKKTKLRLE